MCVCVHRDSLAFFFNAKFWKLTHFINQVISLPPVSLIKFLKITLIYGVGAYTMVHMWKSEDNLENQSPATMWDPGIDQDSRVISRGKLFEAFLSILQIFHSFCLLFYDVP